nr:hypothetical protein [Tanacetum cinerariifolium]
MDNDGDGKIDEKEFLEFMQVQGYCRQATNLYLFKQLDQDGNDDPSGRPVYICLDCFIKQKCPHNHDHLSRFVDNYSLLEAMKTSALTKLARSRSYPVFTPIVHNNTWNIQNNSYLQHSISLPVQHHAPSTAIVPQRQKPWIVALEALNAGLQLGAIGSTFCSIL